MLIIIYRYTLMDTTKHKGVIVIHDKEANMVVILARKKGAKSKRRL